VPLPPDSLFVVLRTVFMPDLKWDLLVKNWKIITALLVSQFAVQFGQIFFQIIIPQFFPNQKSLRRTLRVAQE
jgi:hypothetical protein